MSELPKDLVEEILCRVPVTNLKQLRLTCKEWNHLFKDDSRFARKHSEKSPKEFMALMLTRCNGICPMRVNLHDITPSVEIKLVDRCSSFDGFNITQVFPCDGLLLCISIKDKTKIVVWNPCTGQTKWIATGNRGERNLNLVLGYCQDKKSCGKSYKLLSFCEGKKISQIYDFSSNSWKIIGDYDLWNIRYSSYAVSLKGNVYWFALDDKAVVYLVRFDFSTEKLSGHVSLPYQCHGFNSAILSVVREEKISVLLQRENTSKAEIWVTNRIDETRGVSWSKVLTLVLSPNQIWNTMSFLLDEEKQIAVCCDRVVDESYVPKEMVCIVGEDNKVTQMDFGRGLFGLCSPTILNYVPSLVRIK